ncbi:MAG: MFS transporter [Pseudomonadota bacterium]
MAGFFSGAGMRICDALLPRLVNDFGITAGVAGRVVISFSVAYGLMQLVFGPLGDRFGKARMVLIAVMGCAAGAGLCGLATDFDALVVMRVLWGMAAAGVIPLSMAWIGDAVAYDQRQATLARMLTGTISGMMAGQLAGGLFAESAVGWRGAFFTISAGYAVVGVAMLLWLRDAPGVANPGAKRIAFVSQLQSVLRMPWSRYVLIAVGLEGVFLLGPLAYLPSYLHLRFGIAISTAAALIALYAVGGLLYAILARHIVHRFGERRMVLWGGVMIGAGFIGWLVSPVYLLAGPIALLVGFGTYLFHNTLQTHATQMAPEARGTAVSVFAFCLFVGQAIGVSIAGYSFDQWGYVPMLVVPAVALPAIGWWFARALGKRK